MQPVAAPSHAVCGSILTGSLWQVLEEHAAAKLQQERDLLQMLSKKAAEHRREKAAAMKKAEQKLHEASLKAHETELAARLKAVTQESEAQLSRCPYCSQLSE